MICQIQVVIYQNSQSQLIKLFNAIHSNLRLLSNPSENFVIRILNNDPIFLSNDKIKSIAQSSLGTFDLEVIAAERNLGHGQGHNFLSLGSSAKYLWLMNPDGMPAPSCLGFLLNEMNTSDLIVGAEARQLPFDHPKTFNKKTGEVEWASGACLLIRKQNFVDINGFDKVFFLHGDDVDLSWRLRDRGGKLHYVGKALYFHDKALERNGHPSMSLSERIHGPLGALLLATKYNLEVGLVKMLGELRGSGSPEASQILEMYDGLKNMVERYPLQKSGIAKYYDGWKFSDSRFK
jgi:GT2 family glycosyltransferase